MLQFRFPRKKPPKNRIFCVGSLLENAVVINICRRVKEAGGERGRRETQVQSPQSLHSISERSQDPAQLCEDSYKGAELWCLSHRAVVGFSGPIQVVEFGWGAFLQSTNLRRWHSAVFCELLTLPGSRGMSSGLGPQCPLLEGGRGRYPCMPRRKVGIWTVLSQLSVSKYF